MNYGFGHGDFGRGPFGRPDVAKDALWNRSVPQRNKDDDALVEHDFERWMEVVGEFVDEIVDKSVRFPRQGDPVTVLSARENRETLTVVETTIPSQGVVRAKIDPAHVQVVERMFAQSVDTSAEFERHRNDGWVAVIGGRDYRIVRVRAHDDDLAGSPSLDIRTLENVPASLTVEPPDLLSHLGSNVGIFVDKADPPDFSRRAIFRHRLIRDLKVSSRLFEMLGRIYGFDITVTGLYCVSESFYEGLRQSDPSRAWEYDGQFYTDLPYRQHVFDALPLDIQNLDATADFDVSVTIGSSAESSDNIWHVSVPPGSTDAIQSLGHWVLVDANGVEYYIEEFNSDPVVDEQSGVLTSGGPGPYAIQAAQFPIISSSLAVSWKDKDSIDRSVTDDGAGNLTGDGTGTVDYSLGSISLTADTFTEGGESSDWLPSNSPVAGKTWNDAWVVEPATIGPGLKPGLGTFDSTGPFVGWVAGRDGYLGISIDGGASWQVDPNFPFTEDHLNGVDGDYQTTSGSDVTVWVVGEDRLGTSSPGGVWYYSYANQLWTSVSNAVAGGLLDVAAFDGSDAVKTILAVGYGGVMIYWDGAAMVQTGSGLTANDLNAVTIDDSANHKTFVVGDSGALLQVTAWGTVGDFATATWADQSTLLGGGVADDLRGISFSTLDPNYGIIVGDNSQVWISTDAGVSWSPNATSFSKDWVDCYWEGSGTGNFLVLVASDGTIIRSSDNGSSWALFDLPATGFNGSLIGGAAKDTGATPYGVVVGEGGTIAYYSNDGRIEVPGSGGEILLDYNATRVCVGSLAPPASGAGSLRLKARRMCLDEYKRAAAYRFEIVPNEVLTEPGAEFAGIVDRIEEKIDAYIPIHIRLVRKVFKFQAPVSPWASSWPQLTSVDMIADDPEVNAISGTLFDETPLDGQTLDDGTFNLTATLTLT